MESKYKLRLTDAFVWYNNRVWKNVSGAQITGGTGLKSSQTPTVYNPNVWELLLGMRPDAPCGDLEDWTNAFEFIRYDNTKAVGGDEKEILMHMKMVEH